MTAGALSLVWLSRGALEVVMDGMNDKFGPRRVLTICIPGLGSLVQQPFRGSNHRRFMEPRLEDTAVQQITDGQQ